MHKGGARRPSPSAGRSSSSKLAAVTSCSFAAGREPTGRNPTWHQQQQQQQQQQQECLWIGWDPLKPRCGCLPRGLLLSSSRCYLQGRTLLLQQQQQQQLQRGAYQLRLPVSACGGPHCLLILLLLQRSS